MGPSFIVFQHLPLFDRNTGCWVDANAISTSYPTIHSCSVADIMPTMPGHARKSKNARPRRAPRMSHTTPTSTRKMIVTATSGRPRLECRNHATPHLLGCSLLTFPSTNRRLHILRPRSSDPCEDGYKAYRGDIPVPDVHRRPDGKGHRKS